jgi:hypothetical protein
MSFCPTCRTEYTQQVEYCEVCKTRLLDSPPEGTGLAELAVFPDVPEAEMIKEILEKNGIQSVEKGEVDPIGAVSGADPIVLLVEEKDLPRARELYEAYFAGGVPGETVPGGE